MKLILEIEAIFLVNLESKRGIQKLEEANNGN